MSNYKRDLGLHDSICHHPNHIAHDESGVRKMLSGERQHHGFGSWLGKAAGSIGRGIGSVAHTVLSVPAGVIGGAIHGVLGGDKK